MNILSQAINEFSPTHIFCMFSGGHDSLVATHYTMSNNKKIDGVVHINTGIGIEKTRKFVRKVCKDQEWKLLEYHARDNTNGKGEPDPKIYEDLVCKFGFPGPAFHNVMYNNLKERPVRMLIRDFKQNHFDKIGLCTGVRQRESSRRKMNINKSRPYHVDGAKLWISPIYDWSKKDIYQYIEEHNLPKNEVVDLLHMSYECGCGAFAKPGELLWVRKWFPEFGKEIDRIAEKAKQHGKWSRWGETPPPKGQSHMFDDLDQPLCQDCHLKNLGYSL